MRSKFQWQCKPCGTWMPEDDVCSFCDSPIPDEIARKMPGFKRKCDKIRERIELIKAHMGYQDFDLTLN